MLAGDEKPFPNCSTIKFGIFVAATTLTRTMAGFGIAGGVDEKHGLANYVLGRRLLSTCQPKISTENNPEFVTHNLY